MSKKRKNKDDFSEDSEEDNLDSLEEEQKDTGKQNKKKTIKKKSGNKKQKSKKGKTKIVGGVERVPTGIKNFDKLIQGGFEKNSTNLLVAGGGGGKSIFGMRFLIEGIENGENCLYIMFEEKREEFFSNMKEFGWDMERYEKKGKFTFLEYSPEKVKTMLEEGGGTVESIVLRKKITRVVIDSITAFALLFDSEVDRREAALSLFTMLRKWNCTSLLTYERDPLRDEKHASRVFEFESDSIIYIYSLRTKKGRNRYIEVLKMRGTNHSKQVFSFDIGKQGIIIGTEPYGGKIKLV